MRRADAPSARLQELLALTAALQPTEEERERQLVSLAYGNLKMEEPRVTREMVEQAARASLAPKQK
jgi:hypothetical protein